MFEAVSPLGRGLGEDPLKPNLDPEDLFKGPLGFDLKGFS